MVQVHLACPIAAAVHLQMMASVHPPLLAKCKQSGRAVAHSWAMHSALHCCDEPRHADIKGFTDSVPDRIMQLNDIMGLIAVGGSSCALI